jgi:hypothetical protein
MSEPKDDGPTLPLIPGGMSLRDWFAGQALNAALSSEKHPNWSASILASWTYAIADSMIAERCK